MSTAAEIVRANTRALLRLAEGESGVGRLVKAGIANGVAQRILAAEGYNLQQLEKLAPALGVPVWMLLVEGLDPDDLPTLHQPSTRWPFRRVDQNVIAGLSGTLAGQVEAGLLSALATAGVSAAGSAAARPAAVSRAGLLSEEEFGATLATVAPAPSKGKSAVTGRAAPSAGSARRRTA